ncbi:hypothetical protein HK405_004176, partial [Cladochytrium tenue]
VDYLAFRRMQDNVGNFQLQALKLFVDIFRLSGRPLSTESETLHAELKLDQALQKLIDSVPVEYLLPFDQDALFEVIHSDDNWWRRLYFVLSFHGTVATLARRRALLVLRHVVQQRRHITNAENETDFDEAACWEALDRGLASARIVTRLLHQLKHLNANILSVPRFTLSFTLQAALLLLSVEGLCDTYLKQYPSPRADGKAPLTSIPTDADIAEDIESAKYFMKYMSSTRSVGGFLSVFVDRVQNMDWPFLLGAQSDPAFVMQLYGQQLPRRAPGEEVPGREVNWSHRVKVFIYHMRAFFDALRDLKGAVLLAKSPADDGSAPQSDGGVPPEEAATAAPVLLPAEELTVVDLLGLDAASVSSASATQGSKETSTLVGSQTETGGNSVDGPVDNSLETNAISGAVEGSDTEDPDEAFLSLVSWIISSP